LGATLYVTAFGFTSAYRSLILRRDAGGVRAQIMMLAIATVLFAPVLAAGSVFGQSVTGAVAPAGLQVAIGAFLFGIGMQLGSGCGSGSLYTAGGGNTRMLVVLAAFCAGGFWASLHMGWWARLPVWGTQALSERLGWPAAIVLQLAVLGVLWVGLKRYARGRLAAERSRERLWLAGAGLLAVLNLAVLIVAGHPWTITWAFTLWGAKIAQFAGWDAASSAFWSSPFQREALAGSVLADVTSLMNIGILIGALAGAGVAGRFAPRLAFTPRLVASAVIGGLVMGYGARIAFGCNIGAFFSGVASMSLHGWLWIAAALPGNIVGVRLRPWFELEN
ncbi:MAG: YeeE/YedE family protein, partial [Betaproteobacteria bacterium]|nr:YeeE/YedE family protein [Betaproteobacteria bacterium]